jgi:hypothetical protein
MPIQIVDARKSSQVTIYTNMMIASDVSEDVWDLISFLEAECQKRRTPTLRSNGWSPDKALFIHSPQKFKIKKNLWILHGSDFNFTCLYIKIK